MEILPSSLQKGCQERNAGELPPPPKPGKKLPEKNGAIYLYTLTNFKGKVKTFCKMLIFLLSFRLKISKSFNISRFSLNFSSKQQSFAAWSQFVSIKYYSDEKWKCGTQSHSCLFQFVFILNLTIFYYIRNAVSDFLKVLLFRLMCKFAPFRRSLLKSSTFLHQIRKKLLYW